MTLLKQICSHKTYLMWIKGSMVTIMFNGMCLLAPNDLVLSQLGLEVLEVSPQITLPLLVGLVNFGAPVLNHVTSLNEFNSVYFSQSEINEKSV